MTTEDEKLIRALSSIAGPGQLRCYVTDLLDEVGRLRNIITGLADRVAAQSELLSKRAESQALREAELQE